MSPFSTKPVAYQAPEQTRAERVEADAWRDQFKPEFEDSGSRRSSLKMNPPPTMKSLKVKPKGVPWSTLMMKQEFAPGVHVYS